MRTVVLCGLCLCWCALTSCATHNAAQLPQLSLDLNAQQHKVEEKGLVGMVKPIHLPSELKTYFDYDLIADGILPVQIHVMNKSYGKPCGLNTTAINLVDATGTRLPVLSVDQVLDKVQKSQWRSVGWGVAFGLVGVIPSIINVSQTNDKIRADYEARVLKSGNVVPGAVTEGVMFFSIPSDTSSLDGWKVATILVDYGDSTGIVIENRLEGAVAPRSMPVQDPTSQTSEGRQ
jgi:hypothetical protein